MNTEDMLTELFAHEADRRPDSGAVLDTVHQRIARPGRTIGTRAASAAAVAAIAVTATVITTLSGRHTTAPAGAPSTLATTVAPAVVSSAPATHSSSSPTATTVASAAVSSAPATHSPSSPTAPRTLTPTPLPNAPSAPRVSSAAATRSYSTINAGWFPGPAKQNPVGTSNQSGFEERNWDVTVDGVAMDLIIWTESGGSLPSRMQATGGKSDFRHITTVNGHPAREFIAKNITIIAFDPGNGTIAYVGSSVQQTTTTVTSARITAIAVRVADTMQFNRHDPIPGR